jgi:AcrR family transcriptional regulator
VNWQAVMEWMAERLLTRIDHAARGIESPLEAMRAMFMSHVEFVIEHPGVPRMMFGELQRAEASPAKRMAQTLIQRYAELIRARLEAGKASGKIASETDSQAAAILFIGNTRSRRRGAWLRRRDGDLRAGQPAGDPRRAQGRSGGGDRWITMCG